ncbi:MAG: oligosaccharide flippase family protein [Campylobacterales bacterium]|nr:oligosaccharide flippase family protein [Campylobacterales bacterium]
MSLDISNQRTKNYFKQLKGSFIFKLLAVLSSFLLIPIMIKYLGNEQYGIWSTLLSIISWVVLFDIGIGNGLRNKVAESLAKDDILSAQKYISTSYILIGVISSLLLVVFMLASNFVDWQTIFNTTILPNEELINILNISAGFIFINFWLSLINQVANGVQKSSITVFNQFLSNFLSLISVYILSLYIKTSLINLAIVYGASLLSSSIILSIWFYSKNLNLLPKIALYNRKFVKSITSIGFKFFILQIAAIVIFTTDKILITQLFGPEYIVSYDLVFKIFSLITIIYTLISAPLWSSYSDAYSRNDYLWIKEMFVKQLKIYIYVLLSIIIIGFLVNPIIDLWVNDSIIIDYKLIISIGVFTIISTWNALFSTFVNSINNFDVQFKTSIIAMFLNIPLSILFVKVFKLGIYSIIIASIISLSLFAIFGALQTYNIITRKTTNE